MADFVYNLLIDSHSALEEEVSRLANKVLDCEDRFSRNNIRLRGISKTVTLDTLNQFLSDLVAIVLPHYNMHDLIIDRIHRIPKPKHLSPQVHTDTIARIHFYLVKEELLRVLRSQPELPARFKNISIYPDLSAVTMLKQKEFFPYTSGASLSN